LPASLLLDSAVAAAAAVQQCLGPGGHLLMCRCCRVAAHPDQAPCRLLLLPLLPLLLPSPRLLLGCLLLTAETAAALRTQLAG
jgi:hypothetical protein